MYRYDLLFRNTKTGAYDWIVGFVSLEAAKAYADCLRDARQDGDIVCSLYARTIEGDFHRYRGEGFGEETEAEPESEPEPDGGKRYVVVSDGSVVGRDFKDRRAAKNFIDDHPGQQLRLRVKYLRSEGEGARSDKMSDFYAVPTPQVVKYRYIVVSEGGPVIAREFEDRQSAKKLIDSHPGLLLRLRVRRVDGFAAPSQNPPVAEAPGQGAPGTGNGPADNRGASTRGDRTKSGERPRGQKRPDGEQSDRKGVSPLLVGAVGAGIGAFATNAAFAGSADEGVSPEVSALTTLSALGDDEGASADAAFVNSAGKGVSAELAALTAISAYADGADEGVSAVPPATGDFFDDPPSRDDGSMNAPGGDGAGFEDDHLADQGDGGDSF